MGRYDVLLQQDQKKEARTGATGHVVDGAPKEIPPPSQVSRNPAAEHTSITPLPQTRPAAVQSSKRSFVRRSFDFYEDQVSYLTKASLEERLAGKESSMNAMIREAVDDYIKKRTSRK